jgi:hypothetical protein
MLIPQAHPGGGTYLEAKVGVSKRAKNSKKVIKNDDFLIKIKLRFKTLFYR